MGPIRLTKRQIEKTLKGVDLKDANLSATYAWAADFQEADLKGANLSGAILES
jgi:uncharacterized protein YjbI with pentapeptide repeats